MEIHAAMRSISTSVPPVLPAEAKGATQSTPERSAASPPTTARAVARATATAAIRKFTSDEQQALQFLRQRDIEVRAHEQAHMAVGGRYITSAASYDYQTGPDGTRYAVGGEVGIDTSPIDGDPAATLDKARTVRQAALAPAEPSGQDLQVASAAMTMESNAAQDLRTLAQLQRKQLDAEIASTRAQQMPANAATERRLDPTTAPSDATPRINLTARDQLEQRIAAFFTGTAFGNLSQFA